MTTSTVQLNLRVPPGLVAVLDELADEAGQSRTRFVAQLVKNAQVRRDIERDVAWYRGNERTELAEQVGPPGREFPARRGRGGGRHGPGRGGRHRRGDARTGGRCRPDQMRSIVWVDFAFGRHPALVLTAPARRVASSNVTVVPGHTAIRDGLVARVIAGSECGLAHDTEFDLDSLLTVRAAALGDEIGVLPRSREPEVVAALARAFDLELPVTDDEW